ncbi:hypothetical protein [Streptomyces anulatus]|uniref:hypothetical protein n=1 Tax=Streptomyces anulatus TaxID=1892 RepID=UPI0037DC5C15|nr:hypothetical protein OHB50_38910 [Streptomyces anulatus]
MDTIALFDLTTTPPTAPSVPQGRRSPLPLGVLPVSSVPAAYDREHLYSPKEGTAEYISHRPGDVFGPLPVSRPGKVWRRWWDTEGSTPTPDFLGLERGDVITVVDVGTVTVVSTCRFGALVRFEVPVGAWNRKPYAEMYVTARNQFGHWYR